MGALRQIQEVPLTLPIEQITVSARVRTSPGTAFPRLVASVRAHGVLQPVLVRRVDGQYHLVAGEQRLQAAREAGLAEVPVRVLDAGDAAALEYELAENLTRSNLNPIEQAAGFQRLWQQYGMTHEDIAERFGITAPQVSNRIRLLRLPQDIREAVAEGVLAAQAALCLLRLEEDPDVLAVAAWRMLAEQTPAARANDLVDQVLAAAGPTATARDAAAGPRRGRPLGSGRRAPEPAATVTVTAPAAALQANSLPPAGPLVLPAGAADTRPDTAPAGQRPGPDPTPPYRREKMVSTEEAMRVIRRHLMSCTCRPAGEALNALTDLETITRAKTNRSGTGQL